MDWNYFKFLEAIATSGTLALASKSLGIDTSTLSRNLQKIELEFGTKVFRKQGANYVATPEGVDLIRKCRELKDVVDSIGFQKSQTKRVMVKDEDVCLHCGLCAERCPTAAWDMREFDLLVPYAGRPAQLVTLAKADTRRPVGAT